MYVAVPASRTRDPGTRPQRWASGHGDGGVHSPNGRAAGRTMRADAHSQRGRRRRRRQQRRRRWWWCERAKESARERGEWGRRSGELGGEVKSQGRTSQPRARTIRSAPAPAARTTDGRAVRGQRGGRRATHGRAPGPASGRRAHSRLRRSIPRVPPPGRATVREARVANGRSEGPRRARTGWVRLGGWRGRLDVGVHPQGATSAVPQSGRSCAHMLHRR